MKAGSLCSFHLWALTHLFRMQSHQKVNAANVATCVANACNNWDFARLPRPYRAGGHLDLELQISTVLDEVLRLFA